MAGTPGRRSRQTNFTSASCECLRCLFRAGTPAARSDGYARGSARGWWSAPADKRNRGPTAFLAGSMVHTLMHKLLRMICLHLAGVRGAQALRELGGEQASHITVSTVAEPCASAAGSAVLRRCTFRSQQGSLDQSAPSGKGCASQCALLRWQLNSLSCVQLQPTLQAAIIAVVDLQQSLNSSVGTIQSEKLFSSCDGADAAAAQR